jgi:CO/xanthine dehydrogenase FAD-binding subunit
LRPEELVTEIQIPLPGDGDGSSFQKLTYRSAIDFALVSSAVWLSLDGDHISSARIVVGGAGASPLPLKEAAETLLGKDTSDSEAVLGAADQVRKHAAAFMVDNLGSTREYRQKMAGVMAKRAIEQALSRCVGKE